MGRGSKAKKKDFYQKFCSSISLCQRTSMSLDQATFSVKINKNHRRKCTTIQRFAAAKRNASMFEVLPNYLCGRFDRFLIPVFIGLVNSTSAVQSVHERSVQNIPSKSPL